MIICKIQAAWNEEGTSCLSSSFFFPSILGTWYIAFIPFSTQFISVISHGEIFGENVRVLGWCLSVASRTDQRNVRRRLDVPFHLSQTRDSRSPSSCRGGCSFPSTRRAPSSARDYQPRTDGPMVCAQAWRGLSGTAKGSEEGQVAGHAMKRDPRVVPPLLNTARVTTGLFFFSETLFSARGAFQLVRTGRAHSPAQIKRWSGKGWCRVDRIDTLMQLLVHACVSRDGLRAPIFGASLELALGLDRKLPQTTEIARSHPKLPIIPCLLYDWFLCPAGSICA